MARHKGKARKKPPQKTVEEADDFRFGKVTGAAARAAFAKAQKTRAENRKLKEARTAQAARREDKAAEEKHARHVAAGKKAGVTRRKNKAQQEQAEREASAALPDGTAAAEPGQAALGRPRKPRTLTVTLRPDQWDRLCVQAAERMRKPEYQAAWILHCVLNDLDPKD